jgi:hypothetical protein
MLKAAWIFLPRFRKAIEEGNRKSILPSFFPSVCPLVHPMAKNGRRLLAKISGFIIMLASFIAFDGVV